MVHTYIFVLYDGIENSVFQGQVLHPLLNKLKNTQHVILISFEKESFSQKQIKQQIPTHKNLKFITLKRSPFLGMLSLYRPTHQLKKILSQEKNYSLTARGPIAGLICARALNPKKCISFVIQARGLLADEYRYVKRAVKNPLVKLWHWWRAGLFEALEKKVYKIAYATIESVSPALKNHLVNHLGVEPTRITIATDDLPHTVANALVQSWRHEMRTQLGIKETTHVYCFNGSVKPWQCPDLVAVFFCKQLKKRMNSFLLVLTQDKAAFEKILETHHVPEKKYKVLTIAHTDVYRFLSACDVGLIFREPSVVNWVSRPTKVLEYRAVGLHVIHNNTIAWLLET